ncbi:MAG: SURF1 family protein [Ilumatobacteraceae bacterium]
MSAPGLRRFLSPKWIGFHLLCAAVVVAMVNLGFWQLRRLDEKRTFNAGVQAVADSPIADGVPSAAAAHEFQRVRVSGTYRDRTFTVVNISQDGYGGRDQVALLDLDDGTVLVVNRGFTPGTAALPPLPSGRIEVVGRVRLTQEPRRGQTRDDPAAELTEIRRVELAVLGEQVDDPLRDVYLDVLTEQGDAVPGLVPVAFPTLDEGPHLSYAVQWFIFSVCVIVGWVLAIRRSLRGASPSGRRALIPEQYL